MPLPSTPEDTAWPPRDQVGLFKDMAEADAWYSGDQAKLISIYGGSGSTRRPSEGGGLIQSIGRWFWGRRGNDQDSARQRIHLPAASDIAATSSDLLFGEPPGIQIPEAHGNTPLGPDGQPGNPSAEKRDAIATEERIQELIEKDGWISTLSEAADVCSGIGGVFLRAGWDREAASHPILDVVHGDHAVPEFRRGYLVAVTFWREVVTEGNGTVWRHLERHERGLIMHGLYVGSKDKLGRRVDLSAHPSTAGLAVDENGVVKDLPAELNESLLVRYVPNRRPNRNHRGSPVGQSDTAGLESIMDLLDEAFSAWAREVRLVKPRIIVPNEFLTHRGRGLGSSFDLDAEVFTPLEMDPKSMEKAGITIADFAKHTDEFIAETETFFTHLVRSSGYDPQSFGMRPNDTGDVTATEVRAKESRSLKTTSGKQNHFRPAIEDIAEILLVLDKALFNGKATPMRPRVTFADGLPDDPKSTAEVVELLARAEALSIEAKVRMAQPHLEPEEVAAEVARIRDESGVAIGDPTGGLV